MGGTFHHLQRKFCVPLGSFFLICLQFFFALRSGSRFCWDAQRQTDRQADRQTDRLLKVGKSNNIMAEWNEMEAETGPLPPHVLAAVKDKNGKVAPKTCKYAKTITSEATGLELHTREFFPTDDKGEVVTPARMAFFLHDLGGHCNKAYCTL